MEYVGLNSSSQAVRGYWRVTLGGDVLDWKFLFSNPVAGWPAKVESWRSAVDSGAAKVAASTSPAAVADSSLYQACAVVDVHILGADQGETVGDIARRLNDLTVNVDVTRVALVNNSDPIARDAALQSCSAEQCNVFCQTEKLLTLLFKIAAVLVIGYVAVKLVKEANK